MANGSVFSLLKERISSQIEVMYQKGSTFSQRRSLRAVRLLVDAVRNFYHRQGTTRAAALTYTGMLGVIPLTILLSLVAWHLDSFSLLIGWISHWDARFSLDLPLESVVPAIRRANQVRPSTLGLFGIGSLLITFWLTFRRIEINLNALWDIEEKRPFFRSLLTYFPFLGIITIALTVFTFFLQNAHHVSQLLLHPDTTAPLIGIPLVDLLDLSLVGIVAIALLWGMLFLIYWLMPHARVKIGATIWSASLTTTLMVLFVMGAVKLQTILFLRYSVIYGSLALLPVLLLLSYAAWSLLLFGSSFGAELQKRREQSSLSRSRKERDEEKL